VAGVTRFIHLAPRKNKNGGRFRNVGRERVNFERVFALSSPENGIADFSRFAFS
jgi:hypothetical protein